MSEIASTSPEPAYLAWLALKRLPFAGVSNADSFFPGSQIEQRRLLLLHLLRSTDKPVLIQANAGMGKTSMLGQLQRESAPDLRFCLINSHTDFSQLSAIVLKGLGGDTQNFSSEQGLAGLLQQRLQQLRHLNIVPVLLVDEADQIATEVLDRIKSWLEWQQEQLRLLQVIFTAASAQFQIEGLSLQSINLPALENDEITAYLMHRLTAAGYTGSCPFTDKDMQRLYRLSQGNPGRLNRLAHQQLLGLKTSSNLTDRLPFSAGKILRWSGLVLLGLIFIFLLSYQQQINEWMSVPEVKEQQIEIPDLVAENELATIVLGEEEKSNKPILQQAERDELAELLAEIPEPADEDTKKNESSAAEHAITETTQPVEPDENTESAEPEQAEQIQKEPPVDIPDEEQEKTTVYDQDWILSQPATAYTFQLMGAWTQQEVEAFIEKYALTGDVAQFSSLRNGKPWHVLTYGVYDNKQAALSASKKWPAPLNTLPTWLRRFDSVQKQIKDKGVAP
ncbi:AAA family ATPase [Methylophaga sp. OBS4]|uniref:AAA family ATPase n=1 Tax=Methylophaga sp. OBS4 TaxID=2991935 RepID=UPI00225296F9|nr:AAA family ATPase [Methylophaga sp. OBS4]MCX4186387.1 AAA family ATPase [Methylophaga sp. OBS4]